MIYSVSLKYGKLFTNLLTRLSALIFCLIVFANKAREYRQTEVSLYLPCQFGYHIKQEALNNRTTFLDLALPAFNKFIQNPIPESNLEYWKVQRRNNKVTKKGLYRSSLMQSSDMYNTLKDMAEDRGISFNGL